MSELHLFRDKIDANRTKLAVSAGSAAIGLAGLAYVAHEIHTKHIARPQSLLDAGAQHYRQGVIIQAAGALLGELDIISRSEVAAITALPPRTIGVGLKFLYEHGLALTTRLQGPQGGLETHYMASAPLLEAILADPTAYHSVTDAAHEYYPDFRLDQLAQRLD
jgi:hypothetical protein